MTKNQIEITGNDKIMLIAGHRGFAGAYPENSQIGFEQALLLNLSCIEFDIQLSRDHHWVIQHDRGMKRTSNGSGSINDWSLAELQGFDAGSWFDPQFHDQKIMTLEHLFELCKPKSPLLNIEVKVFPQDDLELLAEHLISRLSVADYPFSQMLISSFSHPLMRLIRESLDKHPKLQAVKLGQLWSRKPLGWLKQLQRINAYSAHCSQQGLSKHWAKDIKQQGYYLACYTVNQVSMAAKLQDWGVDMIFSDHPDRLQAEGF